MTFDPNDFYGKYIGSTLTPDSTIASEVKTNKVTFPDDSLIKGNSVDYTENRYDKSASSYALYQGLSKLQENINAIDPDSHFLLDHTVITLDMIDPNFTRDEYGWDISSNWVIEDGRATIMGEGNNDNYLRMSNRIFTHVGHYYLNVNPARIDSGTIRIYDNLNSLVGEVRMSGETVIELYITNIDIMTLTLVVEDMVPGDIVTLESVHLHKVTDRFRTYLLDKLNEHGLNTEPVDKEQCAAIAADIVDDAVDLLKIIINKNYDELLAHVSDKGNVHGLNIDDIHAADKDHTHDEFGLLLGDHGEIAEHLNNINNPHKITPYQIGAANISHTHTPDECDAAPAIHSHVGQYVGTNQYSNLEGRVYNLEMYSAVININKAVAYPYLILPSMTNKDYDDIPKIGDINKYLTSPYNILQTLTYKSEAYERLFGSPTQTTYNYYGGQVRCSKVPMKGEYDIINIFHDGSTNQYVTFDSEGPTEIILNLNGYINITGYTLYREGGCPTSIQVYNGDALIDDRDISDFLNTVSYELSEPLDFKQLRIVIPTQKLSDDGTWDLGIYLHWNRLVDLTNVAFNMLNTTGLIKHVTIPYPVFTHPVNTTTYVYLKSVQDTYEIVTDNLPPDFDNKGLPVSLLEDEVDSIGNHPLWGSIRATEEDRLYPLYGAISSKSSDSEHFQSTVPSNVQIIHEIPEDRPLNNINNIYFRWTSDMERYIKIPKEIYIELTGKVLISDLDDEGNVIYVKVDRSVLVYKNEDFSYITYPDRVELSVDLTTTEVIDISKITITFNGENFRDGQFVVALQELKIYGSSWWADPYTGGTSDPSMLPVARVVNVPMEFIGNTNETTGEYISIPYAHSRIMYIPLNNLRATNTSTFIYNPFGTLELDVVCMYLDDNKFVVCPDNRISLDVVTIDKIHFKIDVMIDTTPYVYLIKVVRRW